MLNKILLIALAVLPVFAQAQSFNTQTPSLVLKIIRDKLL
jgi:hypothetical protein